MDIPSLFMIPSAVSSGKVHSVFPNSTDADFQFNRDSDATRVNSEGLIERVGYYGSELVANGTFDTDSNWTKGTGWTIANGKATQSGGTGQLSQSISISTGVVCKFTFTATIQSGTLRISAGVSAPVQDFTESGTHTFNLAFAGNTVLYFLGTSSSFSGSIDSISIKEITGDRARLNYEIEGGLVNTKPSLLLEPQRTNAITNSDSFGSTGWSFVTTGSAIAPIVTDNYAISPDGTQNAQRIQFNLAGGNPSRTLIRQNIGSQTDWVLSVYMKSTNGQEQKILWHSNTDSNETTVTGEWQRFTFSRNGISNSWVGLGLNASVSSVDTADILVYGFQAEQGSFSTSLIPTLNGSSQTRAAETCNGAGTSSILPSEEGILYIESNVFANDGTFKFLSLSNGNSNHQNVVWIYYRSDANQINFRVVVNNTASFDNIYTISDATQNAKLALRYKANNFSAWVNGSQVLTDTSGSSFAAGTLTTLELNRPDGANNFYGKIRDIRVYNTKEMTDSEVDILLTKITS